MSNPNPSIQEQWQLKGHNHQIADTGDYDGFWEITNGKVSIFTKDDDEEDNPLQNVVDALNKSECEFYLDDSDSFLMHHFEKEWKLAETRIQELEKALMEAIKVVRHSRNVGFSITMGELRAEGVEAEWQMEQILGKEKYQELCNKTFNKNTSTT